MTRPRFSIGIDLGTTNSALAYLPLEGEAAMATILQIPQWATPSSVVERPTLPSFLYLPEADVVAHMRGRTFVEGDWIIGEFARTKAQEAPGRVAHSAKSWLCHHGADRTAGFLPWASRDVDPAAKISPVRAAALILGYLRGAWADRFGDRGEDWTFDLQEITITVPASFDAAAQRLTMVAAQEAGFPETVHLLEEPQAAFYTWLERHGGEENAWRALAGAGGWDERDTGNGEPTVRYVLVVDIGGGTSDFSLFSLRPDGEIRRIAVSEHILLGGDNIDLALAHRLEACFGEKGDRLDAPTFDFLVARCRELKERTLAKPGPADAVLQVSIPARGAGLLAGARTAEITRAEIDRVILDGFFPACSGEAAPRQAAAALKEWGLPYATDGAITRHLAGFLRGRPRVDAVLFNGGALYPMELRRRLSEQIAGWQGGRTPLALENDDPDLAVARGAARFGRLLHAGRLRIAAGAARAIFLEAQTEAAASDVPAPALVCVLPRGATPEETFAIRNRSFELRINRPIRFQAFASTRHDDVRAGEVLPAGAPELTALPPLETQARVEHPPAGIRTVPVTLEARLNELNLLQVSCRSADPDLRAAWPLDFNLRTAVGETGEGAAAASRSEPNASAAALAGAGETVAEAFTRGPRGRDKMTAPRLLQSLEKILGLPRSDWNGTLVRALWPSLAACADERKRSPEHEETWLILAGYLLRPGFGAAADETRIDSLWQILSGGLRFAGKRVKLQEYILWRRVAGGLSRSRQETVLAGEMDRIRRQSTLPPELVRMTGAFERLDPPIKSELIERYIERAAELARAGRHCAPYLAALGMLLNRAPFYAGPEDVAAPELVERAYDAFARLDWADPELSEMRPLFLRAARVVGNRSLDVRQSVRVKIAGRLEKLGVTPARTSRLRAYVPIVAAERLGLFGEALPPGLILREPA
jgi:molecular chaperone DnaK (HSP70)